MYVWHIYYNGETMKSILLYIKKDIRHRPGSFIIILITTAVMLNLALNFFTVANGFYLAKLSEKPEYHIVLGHLTDADITVLSELDIVDSFYEKYIDDVRHTYVMLKDEDPNKYKHYCTEILNNLDVFETNEYYIGYKGLFDQKGIPDQWTNYIYKNYYGHNVILEYMPMLLIIAVSGIVLTLLLYKLGIEERTEDYAVLRSLGMTAGKVAAINIAEELIAVILGALIASPFSFVTMKIFIGAISNKITINEAVIIYNFPTDALLAEGILIFIGSSVGIFIICQKRLGGCITDLVSGADTVYVPYIVRTSKVFEKDCMKSAHYGMLYQFRNRYTLFYRVLTGALILLLPVFVLSISGVIRSDTDYNMEDNPYIYVSAGSTGISSKSISSEFIDTIANIEGVTSIIKNEVSHDHSEEAHEHEYGQALIFTDIDNYNSVLNAVNEITSNTSLRVTDIMASNKNKENESDFYSSFFTFQAIIIFIDSLIIMYSLYKNILNKRLYETNILRSLGASTEDILLILRYDIIPIVLTFILGIVLGFLSIFALYTEGNHIAFSAATIVISVVLLSVGYFSVIGIVYRSFIDKLYRLDIAEGMMNK